MSELTPRSRRRSPIRDLRIRTKMLVFALVAVAAVLQIGVVAHGSLGASRGAMDRVGQESARPAILLGKAAVAFDSYRRWCLKTIYTPDAVAARAAAEQVRRQQRVVDEALDAFEASGAVASEKATLKDVRGQIGALTALWTDRFEKQAVAATTPEAIQRIAADYEASFTTAADRISAAFAAMIADASKQMDATIASADRAATTRVVVMWSVVVVAAVALVLVGFWMAWMISRPVDRVRAALAALARGDLTVEAAVDSRDEIGQMAAALGSAQSALRDSLGTILTSSTTLAGSAEELSGVSARVSASAEEASVRSGSAASGAEQVSRNVQTVAAATEEMSASIREISENSTRAVRVAQTAAEEAQTANLTVAKLGDSSREIGDVVKVITSIAEQTNLLALNATIEAARAGEAGKGFAVVATEVKELAQGTARATGDISRRIEAIQADTGAAVAAIRKISDIIQEVNSYQATIASAVEEQTATTSEMARSVSEAADGASGIAGNIENVAAAAEVSSAGILQAQRAATELAQLSSDLREIVGRFSL